MLHDNANFRSKEVVRFIQELESYISIPMTLIWDSIPIHRSKYVKDYISTRPNLFYSSFPAYASELNPVDGVWAYVKYGRLSNFAPNDLSELRRKLQWEFRRLRKQSSILQHCIRRTGLQLE
jgi:transposase